MVAELMGHNTGWLTLGAGLAGGADAILVPEISYSVESVADSILKRKASGSNFSIIAVAEGAMSADVRGAHDDLKAIIDGDDDDAASDAEDELDRLHSAERRSTEGLADRLEAATGLEARVTILGHVQRGGTPSPADRLLATRLGTAAADSIARGETGVMIASRGGEAVPVPIEEVAGKRKSLPLDHPWIESARRLGICLGD
jgi:6-phosphofructokinase 1